MIPQVLIFTWLWKEKVTNLRKQMTWTSFIVEVDKNEVCKECTMYDVSDFKNKWMKSVKLWDT